MVTVIEIALVVAAIIAVIVAYRMLKMAKALAVNAIVGVVILLAANFLDVGVELSIWAILICAIAGIPGAILVALLAYLDVAFTATVIGIGLL